MHFEMLVEGQTELTALSILLPKIVGDYEQPHTWRIHKHQGVGRIPDDVTKPPNPLDKSLLNQLPAKLRAYARVVDSRRAVIVLLDLDDNDREPFYQQLMQIVPEGLQVNVEFAIEELEAWFLGDQEALLQFNPQIDQAVLNSYEQDSICGT